MSFILGLQNLRASARTPRYLFRQSRGYYPTTPSPMNFNDGPLVWIDCEMTGLDPSKDKIIEIAVRVSQWTNDTRWWHGKVLITNGNLEIVDSGVEYVIRTDKKFLNGLVSNSPNVLPTRTSKERGIRMDSWCTEQHGRVRLAVACS